MAIGSITSQWKTIGTHTFVCQNHSELIEIHFERSTVKLFFFMNKIFRGLNVDRWSLHNIITANPLLYIEKIVNYHSSHWLSCLFFKMNCPHHKSESFKSIFKPHEFASLPCFLFLSERKSFYFKYTLKLLSIHQFTWWWCTITKLMHHHWTDVYCIKRYLLLSIAPLNYTTFLFSEFNVSMLMLNVPSDFYERIALLLILLHCTLNKIIFL